MKKPFIDCYRTQSQKISFWHKHFPNLFFWPHLLIILLKANLLARTGRYHASEWITTSLDTIRLLEKLGVKFNIDNLSILEKIDGPCVIVGNHMSTLDAFIAPSVIQPFIKFSFVSKLSLSKSPLLKNIINSRDPIIVGRRNPKEDLKYILNEGKKRLSQGTSILVFPQATRTEIFDVKKFNSIGIKLAEHAKVPIIPLALCTNVWKTGKFIKDLGKIEPSKSVQVSFGDPIDVVGRSRDAQKEVIEFILKKLHSWDITIK